MSKKHSRFHPLALILLPISLLTTALYAQKVPNPLFTPNADGILSTYNTSGSIKISNPFFKSLGSNGRTCNSCHVSSEAWTVTPRGIQERFLLTHGTDPIFRTVDGSNCPTSDVSTFPARRNAYSLLLEKGLIRVSLPLPATADFQITGIEDPYNCPQTTSMQPSITAARCHRQTCLSSPR